MTSTRERILYSAAELMRRQGYTGTGVKQVVTLADAPFGSLYHFFPGGKDELTEAVIRGGGAFFEALFEAIMSEAGEDPVAGIEAFFTGAGETLRQTDYQDACPIATIALEVASTNEPLRVATADVFEGWVAAAVRRLVAAGVAPAAARELALVVIALLEGAFLLGRAARSTEPMDAAGRAAVAMVRAALADVRPRPRRRRAAA